MNFIVSLKYREDYIILRFKKLFENCIHNHILETGSPLRPASTFAREGGSSQQPPRGKSHNHQSHEKRTNGKSGKRKNKAATPPQTISVTEIKFANVIRKWDWHNFSLIMGIHPHKRTPLFLAHYCNLWAWQAAKNLPFLKSKHHFHAMNLWKVQWV